MWTQWGIDGSFLPPVQVPVEATVTEMTWSTLRGKSLTMRLMTLVHQTLCVHAGQCSSLLHMMTDPS